MSLSDKNEYVASIATDSISRMTDISDAALRELKESWSISAGSLANANTANETALSNLAKSIRAVRESHEHLSREPAIARVVVIDNAGEERTYYICRTVPVKGIKNLASYRAPVGRLASLRIGQSIVIPNGEDLEVVAKATLHPRKSGDGWDSEQSVIERSGVGPVTITSLREFITSLDNAQNVADILEQIQADERLSRSIFEGLERAVITKMGLRDQPILDSIQDEIFRLPIDSRLIILGPPGTGKTTTLIHRLSQKRNKSYLTEDEQELVSAISSPGQLPHEESWLMFTPTKLLRLYLKEAFAREHVPAPDARIQTWEDFRWNISKNLLGILRGTKGPGVFVLRPLAAYLHDKSQANAINWFEDFFEWQRAEFQREMSEAANALAASSISGAIALSAKLIEALNGGGWNALVNEASRARDLVSGIRGSSDDKINGALRVQIKENSNFVNELAQFIDTIRQDSDVDADELEEGEVPDDDEVEVAHTPLSKAISRYKQALRFHARSLAGRKSSEKPTFNSKLISWIGRRSLSEDTLAEVGKALLVQTRARVFASPIQRYIDGFPQRYRKFRRLRQAEGQWYNDQAIESRDIHPLELDVILLAIIKASSQFLSRMPKGLQLDEPVWAPLKPVYDLFRNQIFVDEATDFSPVQLACMAALAHPLSRSFFACGDFNQRLTVWGTRNAEEMRWAAPGIDFKDVAVAYRQTKQLNSFAQDIVSAVDGSKPINSLPVDIDNEGVPPVLVESLGEIQSLAVWLAARLLEIERFVGQIPSTAIFVNSEEDVSPLADELNRLLFENNLRVVACSQGQIVGQDSDIRVFDIQHIKGLEFEAVFFTAVDRLAEKHPTLFGKFLYVGATRAATYLGLTCESGLPGLIDSLRPHFSSDWSSPGRLL